MIVTPGEALSSGFEGGSGTYSDEEGVLRSCVLGHANYMEQTGKVDVSPLTGGKLASEVVVEVGDRVWGKVTRINMNQATLEIFRVGDNELQQCPKGIIRREDVRLSEIDKVLMQECFIPGDIVVASVLSLGDARQYYLSTSASDFGVTQATSLGGLPLMPVAWNRMKDENGNEEPRKVAKPDSIE